MDYSSAKCKNGCADPAELACSVCDQEFCYTCLKLHDKAPVCQACHNKMGGKRAMPDLRLIAGIIGSGVIFLVYHLVQMIPHP